MQRLTEALASRYPHLIAAFENIPQGEMHLRRLQDLNQSWRNMLGPEAERQYTEVVVTEKRALDPASETFDIIYAGGGLNLLNAAVMTLRYGLRVLVFDRFTVGAVHREWNISRQELRELLEIGLLTPDELESVIQREYKAGLVSFHAANISVPRSDLYLKQVLDVAIDAERLTTLCIGKILQSRPGQAPNVILHNTSFTRCSVQPTSSVVVDVISQGERYSYTARLLIDGMGSTSPIACQFNCGRPFSLVCPTVGTVARGYPQGRGPGQINPDLGEVLVTNEDALDERQLIWEAFPGRDDQVAIYLFHYAETREQVDLLELFERFFQLLPSYKECQQVEIIKPVYGFIPAGYNITLPWQRPAKVLAYDRVLSLGDAAAFQSPLTFCGFGSYVRNLRRITALLHLALAHNCLSASELNGIRASEAVPAVARAFSKFMIAKPAQHEPIWQVNETFNVFCRVLNDLGPGVTNAFFQDRIGWLDYTRLVLRTPAYYPAIYTLALKTLSPAEMLGWLSAWLKLGQQACTYSLYRLLRPLLRAWPVQALSHALRKLFPHPMLRYAAYLESMEQIRRNKSHDLPTSHRLLLTSKPPYSFWPRG
jgi:lycopene cyclase CruA